MPPRSTPIVVEGLKEARRDLRRVDRALAKELRGALKDAAEVVAAEARRQAPHRTGRLAKSIRAGASGSGAVVRAGGARVPYANPVHWGWKRHGIEANPFIERAADKKADEALERLADNMDALFKRNGFK